MEKSYPETRNRLRGLMKRLSGELPGPISGFAQLHRAALSEGALSTKVKELMALSIAIAARCDGCIAYHVYGSLRAGATRAEVLDAIGVAVLMGGGPASVYGCEALDALDQFAAIESGNRGVA